MPPTDEKLRGKEDFVIFYDSRCFHFENHSFRADLFIYSTFTAWNILQKLAEIIAVCF